MASVLPPPAVELLRSLSYPERASSALRKHNIDEMFLLAISLRKHCGHEKFGIYDGESCYPRVQDVELLSLSIVKKPVQRYSVAFLTGDESSKSKDHYNYSNVRFVADRVDSPFHEWEAETTTRTLEISDVAHLLRDDP